jgi:methyltransferase
MVGAYLALLGLIAAERVAELLLSRRNARIAFARGGKETGAAHFRWMTLVHALFLPCCAVEVLLLHRPFPGLAGFVFAAGAIAAQGLRWWAIASLGWRWNVRVIVVPTEPPVRRGPYRLLRHPNYVAVALEMVCVPMTHCAFLCAALFSLLNALLLRVRIRVEEQALGAGWEQAFSGTPRFFPHG